MRIQMTQDMTFYCNFLMGSDTTGDGLTKFTAFKTPQYMRDYVYRNYDCNLFAVKFSYADCGVPYPGVIMAYELLGLGHDYGETHEAELDVNGNVAVLISDTGAGCFHAAHGAQPYIRNFGMVATNGACCVTSAYGSDTLATIEHCVFYGADGRNLMEAGPSGGRISVDSECWVINQLTGNTPMANTLFHATDGGVIVKQPAGRITFQGTVAPKFAVATAAATFAGRVDLNGQWAGGARGYRWHRAAGGMLITHGLNPDTYIPGDANGYSADGTGFNA